MEENIDLIVNSLKEYKESLSKCFESEFFRLKETKGGDFYIKTEYTRDIELSISILNKENNRIVKKIYSVESLLQFTQSNLLDFMIKMDCNNMYSELI